MRDTLKRALFSPLPPVGWRAVAIALLPVAAVVAGAIVRLRLVVEKPFPLNDGGLFYQLSLDIARAGFALPPTTTYNQLAIPFAYPPLGFYLAAWLTSASGWDLIDIYRLLPALINIAAIAAFYLLARRLLGSALLAGTAAVAFALTPRSMTWMIIGGGMARAPGMLFSLLTLYFVHRMVTAAGRGRWTVGMAAAAGALTVLSHAEWAWFTAFSAGLMVLSIAPGRRNFARALAVAGLVALLAAPWWITVVARHGLAPFAAAFATSDALASPLKPFLYLAYNFTDEPMLGVFAALSLVGLAACAAAGHRLLVLWFAVILALNQRSAATTTMIPLAMSFAVLLHGVLLPGLARLGRGSHDRPPSPAPPPGDDRSRRAWWAAGGPVRAAIPGALLVAALLVYGGYGAFVADRPAASPLRALDEEQRVAMAWVRGNTPPASRFLVVTSAFAWELDAAAEWFPVLAERVSVGTVQGREWLPGHAFREAARRFKDLQGCAGADAAALQRWAAEGGTTFTHVYVAPTVTGALVPSLKNSPDYRPIYDRRDVRVFALQPAAAQGPAGTSRL